MPKRAFRARKSRLDPFVEFIGHEPDAVVARRAAVTPEAVRTYRVRRGIPAIWRGEVPGVAPVGQQVVDSPQLSEGRKRAFRGRRSRLDPYQALLGVVADQELAAKAGVTVENVRSYRRRRQIQASWREERVSEPTPGQAAEPAQWAYRVTVRSGQEDRDYVVLAVSLSDAARQAEQRVSARAPGALLVQVATLAEVL